MPAFYLTLIAALLAGIGARDQATVAALVARQGRRPAVLVVALGCAVATAVVAALAARWLLGVLPPPARGIFGGIALAMAGIESLAVPARRAFREPTHSLGALALVLLAQQLTDAMRFVVFGLGVAMAAPFAAGAAGVLAGTALGALAWRRPEWPVHTFAWLTRRVAGGLLVLGGTIVFLAEFGLM